MPINLELNNIDKIFVADSLIGSAYVGESLVYEDFKLPYAKVIINKNNPDYANIEGDINKGPIKDISLNFKRCLCKRISDNKVAICFLDKNNSEKYHDGTPARLDGSEGDVMVYIPDIYYKRTTIDSDKYSLEISDHNVDGSYKVINRSLLGAYRLFIKGRMAYSRSGVVTGNKYGLFEPKVDNNSSLMRLQQLIDSSINRGEGYRLEDIYQRSCILLILYLKYGTRHLYVTVGGANSATKKIESGFSNTLGNNDSVYPTTNGNNALGFEDFGSDMEVIYNLKTTRDYIKVIRDDGSEKNVPYSRMTAEDIKKMVLDDENELLYIASEFVQSGDTGDYYGNSYISFDSIIDEGSYKIPHSENFWGLDGGSYGSVYPKDMSSRLSFKGEIVIVDDVQSFKNNDFTDEPLGISVSEYNFSTHGAMILNSKKRLYSYKDIHLLKPENKDFIGVYVNGTIVYKNIIGPVTFSRKGSSNILLRSVTRLDMNDIDNSSTYTKRIESTDAIINEYGTDLQDYSEFYAAIVAREMPSSGGLNIKWGLPDIRDINNVSGAKNFPQCMSLIGDIFQHNKVWTCYLDKSNVLDAPVMLEDVDERFIESVSRSESEIYVRPYGTLID